MVSGSNSQTRTAPCRNLPAPECAPFSHDGRCERSAPGRLIRNGVCPDHIGAGKNVRGEVERLFSTLLGDGRPCHYSGASLMVHCYLAVDQHERDAYRELHRVVVGRSVDDVLRVEDHDVCEVASLDPPSLA